MSRYSEARVAIQRSNAPRDSAGGCDTRGSASTRRAVHARQGLGRGTNFVS